MNTAQMIAIIRNPDEDNYTMRTVVPTGEIAIQRAIYQERDGSFTMKWVVFAPDRTHFYSRFQDVVKRLRALGVTGVTQRWHNGLDAETAAMLAADRAYQDAQMGAIEEK